MGFSAKQVQALRRQPNRSHIRTREAHGRELTYLEGWYAISEANRIFGFDGWIGTYFVCYFYKNSKLNCF